MTAQASRDGGGESLEVSGILHVRAGDERSTKARIRVDLSGATSGSDKRPPASFQTHPNMDKPTFQVSLLLTLTSVVVTFHIFFRISIPFFFVSYFLHIPRFKLYFISIIIRNSEVHIKSIMNRPEEVLYIYIYMCVYVYSNFHTKVR